MKKYKCLNCGRDKFTRPYQPHKCNGQYKKRGFKFGFIETEKYDPMCRKAMFDFNTVGKWLSAALDDPKVCNEMKEDIKLWMDETYKHIEHILHFDPNR